MRNSHRWSQNEIQFLKENVHKMTYKQLAEHLVLRSPGSISSKVRELKLIEQGPGKKNHKVMNEFIDMGTYFNIPIYDKRTNKTYNIKVSPQDVEDLKQYRWYIGTTRGLYVKTDITVEKNKYKTIWMHRYLMGNPQKGVVDHINNDSLDNRRENLRIVSSVINGANHKVPKTNKTGVKGLCVIKRQTKQMYSLNIRRGNSNKFHKLYQYNEEGKQQAILDERMARNYIYRDTELYDPSIPCTREIIQQIEKKELNSIDKQKQKYGYSKFKDHIRELDNYRCRGCGLNLISHPEQLEVHHIIPRSKAPELFMDEKNCVSVCRECHNALKGKEIDASILLHKITRYR